MIFREIFCSSEVLSRNANTIVLNTTRTNNVVSRAEAFWRMMVVMFYLDRINRIYIIFLERIFRIFRNWLMKFRSNIEFI